ncbi:MAG TPA: HU family DNA-binding protein [Kiritimatiellia bacterium]|jgi:DNA-binding protein HU-beta|nr:HU family DNA-binding protein [Kiritimatiellia bacterium]HOM58312.1 HU family DNA-binding protein [Kiritimatiellia bacterium]HOR97793.1 HU family DNA-binding protein [Kiritimatiellia bacterium]HPC49075.1 HU family DNA-binding protein [Kiritimatiellia bacterium]HPK37050.1 HU family DNA-binding protein [Kiritimatiellia bacterium]
MAKKATPKTKSEIMAALAAAGEISKKQASTVYEALLKIAYTGAKDPKGIMLPGLGKLIKVKRAARKGRNPATGAEIKIPAKTVVKFRLAKAAKDAVLGK